MVAILGHLRTCVQEPGTVDLLSVATSVLNSFIDIISLQTSTETLVNKIAFIRDQLTLSVAKPGGKRYTPLVMRNAFIWHSVSAAGYEKMSDSGVLTLPHVRTLQKITAKVDADLKKVDMKYLSKRVSKLDKPNEKDVLLSFDEVCLYLLCISSFCFVLHICTSSDNNCQTSGIQRCPWRDWS